MSLVYVDLHGCALLVNSGYEVRLGGSTWTKAGFCSRACGLATFTMPTVNLALRCSTLHSSFSGFGVGATPQVDGGGLGS